MLPRGMKRVNGVKACSAVTAAHAGSERFTAMSISRWPGEQGLKQAL